LLLMVQMPSFAPDISAPAAAAASIHRQPGQ
jgi:hypothetical protein